MGKTSKRVISLVLSVLMVLSMVSVFCLPTMAAPYDAENIDYDEVRTTAYIINSAWTTEDLAAGAELSYYYRGKTYTVTYDASRHFSSYAAASDAYFATDPDILNDVPVFIFAPGTYTDTIIVRYKGVILGANAGISPNAEVSDWTLEGMKDGWAANEAWDTENETVFSGGVYRSTRVDGEKCVEDKAELEVKIANHKWAYKLEAAEKAQSQELEPMMVIDGVSYTGDGFILKSSDFDNGKTLTDGSEQLPAYGYRTAAYTIQNVSSKDQSTCLFNAWDTARNYDTFTVKNMRVSNFSGLSFFQKYIENVTIDGLYFTASSGRLLGYEKQDGNAFGPSSDTSAVADQTFEMKNSMIYKNTEPYPIAPGNLYSGDSFSKQDFTFDNNIFYDSVCGSANWGRYGVFALYNQNPNYQYNVTITNNQFHQTDWEEYTLFNGNAERSKSPMSLVFKNNIITGEIAAIYPNLGPDFTTKNPEYISTRVSFDFAENYWASVYGQTGKRAAFSSESNANPEPFANGFDWKTATYYLDPDMTVLNTNLDITAVEGLGNNVTISENSITAACTDMTGTVTPKFTTGEGSAAAIYSDSSYETPVENIDFDSIDGRVVYYVRVEKSEYTKDYTLELIVGDVQSFNELIGSGGIDGFTKGYTVAYVPNVDVGDTILAYWNGTYYSFDVDNDAVFSSLDVLAPVIEYLGEELNIILPALDYGKLTIPFAANFYGTNYNIDPVNKSAAVNKEDAWTLNTDWGVYGETSVTSIDIAADVVADGEQDSINLYGLTLRGLFNDTSRNTNSGNLDITLKNFVVDLQGASANFNYLFDAENARTQSADSTFLSTYTDSLTIENVFFKDLGTTGSRRFLNECIPANVLIKNVFWNGQLSGASGVFGWVKNGDSGTVSTSLTVEDSMFREIGAPAFFQLESQGAIASDSSVEYKAAFRNNIFVNKESTADTMFISFNSNIAQRFTGIEIVGNTFLNLNGLSTAIGLNDEANIADSNGDGIEDTIAAGTHKLKAENVVVSDNDFINCVNDAFRLSTINKFSNSFYTTTLDNEYLNGSNPGCDNTDDYWLDIDRTIKNTDFDIQSIDVGESGVISALFDNAKNTISFQLPSGSTEGMTITLPDGITGQWYTSGMEEVENIAFEDLTELESTYYYVTTNGSANRRYTVSIANYVPTDFVGNYVQEDGIITDKALMVDPAVASVITGGKISLKWDGKVYDFYAGTNAFAKLSDALAYAAEKSINVPEILVNSWAETDLNITKPMKIFAPNYNTMPYIADAYGVESDGGEWAENPEFTANQVTVRDIVIGADVAGSVVEIYGFTFTENFKDTTRAQSDLKTKVSLINALKVGTTNESYIFQVENANTGYAKTGGNVNNTDELLVKNLWIKEGGSGSRLIGEMTPSITTFDGLYADAAADHAHFSNQRAFIKSDANTWIFTIKNSNLRTWHSDKTAYPADGPLQLEGFTDKSQVATPDQTRKLVYENNILHEFGNQTGAGGVGPWYMIRWFANSFNGLEFHDNYVDAGENTYVNSDNESSRHSLNFFHTSGVTVDNQQSITGQIDITGNLFNGTYLNLTVDDTGVRANNFTINVADNFVLRERTDDLDSAIGQVPAVHPGHVNQTIGDFWKDAAMTEKVSSTEIYDFSFTNDGSKYFANGAAKTLRYKVDAEDTGFVKTVNEPAEEGSNPTYTYTVDMSGFIEDNLYNIITLKYNDTEKIIDAGKSVEHRGTTLSFTSEEQLTFPVNMEVKVYSPDYKTSVDTYSLTISDEFTGVNVDSVSVGDVAATYDSASGAYKVTLPADGANEAINVSISGGGSCVVKNAEGSVVTTVGADLSCTEVTYTITVTDASDGSTKDYKLIVVREHVWNEGEVTTEPTCSAEGVKTYTCQNNPEHTRTEAIEIDPEAHDWDAGTVTTEPTCSAEGEKTYTCQNNSAHTKKEAVAVNPEAHAWDKGTVITPATCQTTGKMKYTCQNNSDHTRTEDIPKNPNAHVWNAGTVTTEPTCTKEGVKTVSCTEEGCDVTGEEIKIPALGHLWDEGEVTTPATCTEEGVMTYHCTRADCDGTKTEPIDIDPEAHAWDAGTVTTEPTCSAKGVKTYTCQNNSEHKKTEEVAVNPEAHAWDAGTVTTEPTCTEEGEKTYTCQNNSAHTKKEAVAVNPDAHVWDEGTVTTPATCTEEGEIVYHCTEPGCDGTKKEVIPVDPTAHAWDQGEVTKEPTCSAKGETTYHCTREGCDGTKKEPIDIDPDAHAWNEGEVTTAPTCSKEGVKTYTCKNDASHTKTESIPADSNAHVWGEYVYNNDATTEADGTETAKCQFCDATDTRTAEGTKITIVDSTTLFTDMESGRWYKEYVDYVATFKLMNGMTPTTFEPTTTLNRAMFVQILANMSGVDTSDSSVGTVFTDVPAGKWYTPAVKWAYDNGIVDGMTPTTFEPLEPIQRQQICVMAVRYAEKFGIELTADIEKKAFEDDSNIQNYAKEAVYICQQAGIVDGKTETEFKPRDNATRAEIATIITRFHQNFVAGK